jgi:hypothetical protein
MKIEKITIEINKANLDSLDGILQKIKDAEMKFHAVHGSAVVVDVVIK